MKLLHTSAQKAGAIFWVLSIQYYVVQAVAALAWNDNNPYSWTQNTISDLANTTCGPYGDRLVCSPQHAAMNLSFLLLGVTMIAGAYLLAQDRTNTRNKLGFLGMALAGVGTVLVGLFPENSVAALHVVGAALAFVCGSLGMILIGSGATSTPKILRLATVVAGAIGLAALLAFVLQLYGPLGIGGLERIVAYPQSIWMICMGLYLLAKPRKN